MKKHIHQFILTITTEGTKESARTAVLTSFALRNPDGCSFDLKPDVDYKKAWMEGAQAGTEIAFDLFTLQLQKLKESMGIETLKDAIKDKPTTPSKKAKEKFARKGRYEPR